MSTENETVEELDALIVGGGFAGIYQLDRLRDLGYSAKIFEAGSGLGGIWYWNCYPGARVDSEGAIYQFAYKDLWKDWDYKYLYPDWREVREYFAYVDRKLNIRKDVRFDTRVEAAEFDSGRKQWVVRSSDGSTTRCTFLLPCLGFAAKPYIPPIAGLESFTGARHHTALWPQDGVDFSSRRVGVIGSGASAVQVIQEGARTAAELTVFQRTPNMALPMGQRQLTPDDQAALKKDLSGRLASRGSMFAGFDFDFRPLNATDLSQEERTAIYEELWQMGGLRFWLAACQDLLFDQRANDYAYEFWRDKVRQRIEDPELAEKLAPTEPVHPFGVKRPSLEENYYEVFNQDNVHLVDLNATPLEHVTETGVRTADGIDHEFDVIVLATGFDAVSGGLTSIDIRGIDGTLLRDKWASGVKANLGVATAGFPNMLFAYGPQSPSGFCNGPTCAEIQGEMIVEMVDHALRHGNRYLESTPEADEKWSEHIAELVAPSLFGKAKSWYMGSNIPGKPVQSLNYPGGLPVYRARYEESKAADYEGFRLA